MYHSITYGDKNTWDDWHLIPASRPLFNPPSVKTNYVDIPGANGSIDLTESLTGHPVFSNRTGSHNFIVMNGYWDWTTAYSTIMEYLHGKRMRAVLEDDPAFYYEGRFSVSAWNSGKSYSTISINYDVSPFKKSIISTKDEWLWDTFNFETGIIQSFIDVEVVGFQDIVLIGSIDYESPTIIASSEMTLQFDGKTYNILSGEHKYFDVVLKPGENVLKFIGNGTVTIDYRRGGL